MRSFVILILAILIVGCESNTRTPVALSYTNISVKDSVWYGSDSIRLTSFTFSPIDSNRVWTFNTNGPSYELNLSDGIWSSLDKRFGPYSRCLRKENIVLDTIDKKTLWVYDSSMGIICYDIMDCKYIEFNMVKGVLTICLLEKKVVFGTGNGLFIFDRANGKIAKSKCVANGSIGRLERISPNVLLINDQVEYDPDEDKIIRINHLISGLRLLTEQKGFRIMCNSRDSIVIEKNNIKAGFNIPGVSFFNIAVDDEDVWIPSTNLCPGIYRFHLGRLSLDTIQLKYSLYSRQMVNESDEIWFCGDYQIIRFNKNDYSYRIYESKDKIEDFMVDSRYLYLCTFESFRIYSKSYVDRRFVSLNTLLEKYAKDTEILDSLDLPDSLGFVDVYRLYGLLKRKYNKLSDEVQSRFFSLFYTCCRHIQRGNPNEIDSLLLYISDSVKERDIKINCFMSLINLSNYNGRLIKTLMIDSLINLTCPECRGEYYMRRMVEVKKAYEKLRCIRSSHYNRDRRLWETGKLYYDLFLHVGPEGECTINMSFPFLFLDSLLRLYPESSYADNAEFIELLHVEEGSHEEGDDSFNMEAAERYQALIKKYPGSELVPDMYLKICELYFWYGSSGKQKIRECKRALKYADKLISEFPSFASEQKVKELRDEISAEIADLSWDFSVRTNSTEYIIPEPVFVTIFLKNTGPVAKTIKVPKDRSLPAFPIWIDWYSSNSFEEYGGLSYSEEISFRDKETNDSIIQPGCTYTETQCLTLRALRDCGYQYGKYTFLKDGVCKLGSYMCLDNSTFGVNSDTISFKVHGKKNKRR